MKITARRFDHGEYDEVYTSLVTCGNHAVLCQRSLAKIFNLPKPYPYTVWLSLHTHPAADRVEVYWSEKAQSLRGRGVRESQVSCVYLDDIVRPLLDLHGKLYLECHYWG